MNKKFELNGVNVELSKEKLQDMLKEYDKPLWGVEKDEDGYIILFKKDEYMGIILKPHTEEDMYNLSTVSRDMASKMNDLMETKDVLDLGIHGYWVFYSAFNGKWTFSENKIFTNAKHFKTEATAKLAANILNESKDMKEWIERMSK